MFGERDVKKKLKHPSTERTAFMMTEEEKAWLLDYADRTGQTLSDVIREALNRLAQEDRAQ